MACRTNLHLKSAQRNTENVDRKPSDRSRVPWGLGAKNVAVSARIKTRERRQRN